MRIIGQIDHPSLKISVFKNEGRTSVKFETSLYEQTFKMGDDERFATLEGIAQWADKALIEQVMDGFRQMHAARLESMNRNYPASAEFVFETII